MRFALRLEFDGANFCGWQEQSPKMEAKCPSVQKTVQKSLQKLFGTRKKIYVQGCGRTDAGVHAEEYVVHVDLPEEFYKKFKGEARRFRLALNSLLPASICAKDVAQVPDDFEALSSAVSKVYEYRILLKMAKPVLDLGRVHWIPSAGSDPFDIELLKQSLKLFEGEKDFAAFASAGHNVKSTVRRILRVSCEDEDRGGARGRLMRIQFEGEGFLKQQVRNMVGSLVAVATKKRPPDFIEKTLAQSKGPSTRISSLYCAPPEGLFLVRVNYDRPIFSQET